MENITIEMIRDFVINLSAFLVAGGTIGAFAIKFGKSILNKELIKPFNDRIDNLEKSRVEQHEDTINRINNVQLYSDKNFLVRFLADIEQGNKVDEVEKERFYEVYKDYRRGERRANG
jgi:hypothetical protein